MTEATDYTHRIEGPTYYHERKDPPALGFVSLSGEAFERRGLRVRVIGESAQRFAAGQARVLVRSEPFDCLPSGGFAWVSAPFMLTPIPEPCGVCGPDPIICPRCKREGVPIEDEDEDAL